MDLPQRLSASVEAAGARVLVGYPWWLRPVLARNVVAITLGRRIYVRGVMAADAFERLLRHELAHVRQVNRLGLVRFLWRYVTEFLRHWWRVRSVAAAYTLISFEIEAYAEEEAGEPTGL
jgi:hypothetical protein